MGLDSHFSRQHDAEIDGIRQPKTTTYEDQFSIAAHKIPPLCENAFFALKRDLRIHSSVLMYEANGMPERLPLCNESICLGLFEKCRMIWLVGGAVLGHKCPRRNYDVKITYCKNYAIPNRSILPYYGTTPYRIASSCGIASSGQCPTETPHGPDANVSDPGPRQ